MEAATRQAKEELLSRAGLAGSFAARRLKGGRNNRVWRLGGDGRELLLKEYFHGPDESRDRQATEWGFLNFAWSAGLRSLPMPVAALPEMHASLLGFLPGRRLRDGEASWPHLAQAADFVAALNQCRHLPEAAGLPLASEGCLSLGAHLACLQRRLMRLDEIADPAARAFALEELVPAGRAQVRRLHRWAMMSGLSLDRVLTPGERCLSPSDFGFQNALMDEDGHLYFLDFEYAGWDDPAKLVCDFFAQPEVAIDAALLEAFARRAFAGLLDIDHLLERTRALLSLHWLKWCCILLGEFLSGCGARRAHASGRPPDPTARARQLEKARAHLRRIPLTQPTR